ncbi:MAG: exodeoxyribonuclease VII large subunit [Bacteroidota bacterium]
MTHKTFSLSEIALLIKNIISDNISEPIWIVAEISEININHNGHCYLELIEKEELKDNILARFRATIWSHAFRMIKPYFETSTGQRLGKGLKILIQVSVEFHEVYSLSLNVINIDPAYTVGELEMRKQQIINTLKEEGVYYLNQELEITESPQKIAVISSETAAGYGDWLNQIKNNTRGYVFYHKLFPAIMQGDKAESTIISALNKINEYQDFFDLVVIIRGGGSQSDMNCFNRYELASNIAQFPLPVITGIGHERDETICDLVACKKLKTPTAVAEFLVNRLSDFENYIDNTFSNCVNTFSEIIYQHSEDFENHLQNISFSVKNILIKKHNEIDYLINGKKIHLRNFIKSKSYKVGNYKTSIKINTTSALYNNKIRLKSLVESLTQVCNNSQIKSNYNLQLCEQSLHFLDPQNVLSRGYSITYQDNKLIKDSSQLKQGSQLFTLFQKGSANSTVTEVSKSKKDK